MKLDRTLDFDGRDELGVDPVLAKSSLNQETPMSSTPLSSSPTANTLLTERHIELILPQPDVSFA